MTSLPPGVSYLPDFLSRDEHDALLEHLGAVTLHEVRMHGVVARRTVTHFGWDYGYDSWTIERTAPLPEWLLPIRARAAAHVPSLAAEPERLEQVLIARYPPGATIGWHRDAPMFGPEVIGVSLGAPVTMRFRPFRTGRAAAGRRDPKETVKLLLEPRSLYVIAGEARTRWQHSTTPVRDTRWSITFRTVIRKPE